jgi:hypothetical protein
MSAFVHMYVYLYAQIVYRCIYISRSKCLPLLACPTGRRMAAIFGWSPALRVRPASMWGRACRGPRLVANETNADSRSRGEIPQQGWRAASRSAASVVGWTSRCAAPSRTRRHLAHGWEHGRRSEDWGGGVVAFVQRTGSACSDWAFDQCEPAVRKAEWPGLLSS